MARIVVVANSPKIQQMLERCYDATAVGVVTKVYRHCGVLGQMSCYCSNMDDCQDSQTVYLLFDGCFFSVALLRPHAMMPPQDCRALVQQFFGFDAKRQQYKVEFEREWAVRRDHILGVLCRDIFTILYAEPTLNYAAPDVAHMAIDKWPRYRFTSSFARATLLRGHVHPLRLLISCALRSPREQSLRSCRTQYTVEIAIATTTCCAKL